MERYNTGFGSNHWNDQNTDSLIKGITGIAGQVIANKTAGKQLTAQEQQLAALAQQTVAALGQANSQTPTPTVPKGFGFDQNTVLLIVGAMALVGVGLFLFGKK